MKRVWTLKIYDGKKYRAPAEKALECFTARSPKDAMRIAGLDDPMYEAKYSRKGYGHYTGRVSLRSQEALACVQPQPADFILEVIGDVCG